MALLTELDGHTLVVTISRPEVLNAINRETWDALGDAVETAEADPRVRSVVLTGAGERAFCSGTDLKGMVDRSKDRTEVPRTDARREAWGYAGVASHPISKPMIAAVNGLALGGGFEIVLACDLVVAADTSFFGLPEVKRGLIAGGGGAFRLPERLPRAVALELLLTGDPLDVRRAHELGIVNRVVPQTEVLTSALELAARLNQNAPLAVQATKRVATRVRGGRASMDEHVWLLNDDEVRKLIATNDAREGPRAFAEKRTPVWTGT